MTKFVYTLVVLGFANIFLMMALCVYEANKYTYECPPEKEKDRIHFIEQCLRGDNNGVYSCEYTSQTLFCKKVRKEDK